MSIDLSQAACRLPGCGGPVSGVCINQVPFDECPNVIPADEVGDIQDAEALSAEATPDTVSTGRTGALSLEETDAFLRAYGGIVLAVIAGPEAGKTTFASALYDLMRRGLLNGLGFAGSETIKGFEERCFDARVASEQNHAVTLRTPRAGPLLFMHLRVAVTDGRKLNMLISDRSGEHFDLALNTPAQFCDFHEIERADAILLLVDGEKLATGHQAETARLRKLILAVAQTGHLSNKTVHLVVTKADLLTGEAQRALVDQRANVIAEELRRRGEQTRVELHFTACRARQGQSTFGEGIQSLIKANIPEILERSFTTTFWTPGDGGTALDRLMHVARWQ